MYFPHLARLTTDFSPAYLQREIGSFAGSPPQAVFLGDSVVWGYRLPAQSAAVTLLAQRGCACRNLAFKAGSPPNYYAIARLLVSAHARPKTVVIQINQKVLNQTDPAYRTLHPAVAELAGPLLTAADDRTLTTAQPNRRNGIDRLASHVSSLYAMRSDIRETLYGESAEEAARPVVPDAFEGAYDLSPLTPANTGVAYLLKAVRVLQAAGIPVVAFMT